MTHCPAKILTKTFDTKFLGVQYDGDYKLSHVPVVGDQSPLCISHMAEMSLVLHLTSPWFSSTLCQKEEVLELQQGQVSELWIVMVFPNQGIDVDNKM